jgi:predicted dehydrogenase
MTTASTALRPLRIGIIGFGWMGQVHARAYTRLAQYYPDLPVQPELVAVADNAADSRLTAAVAAFGFRDVHADWNELVARDDIDVVSVTGPNFIHRDVSVSVAESGKHLWVEKPAGRNAAETREIAAAVAAAGIQSAAGFNYRNAPAVEKARTLIQDGRLGTVRHVRIRMLADYAAHPEGALTWRYQNQWSGSGVAGDLVSHGIDLARYVVGEISELFADTAIFIPQRPALAGVATGHGSRGGGELGPVENEDFLSGLLRFEGGARGVLESCRTSVGEQCTYGIEVHGDRGALVWDFRRMGELELCLDQDFVNASYVREFVGPGAGDFATYQPAGGISMSYDDLKVIEANRLASSIASGIPQGATITDAVVAAELVDAMLDSVHEGRWVSVSRAR